MSAKKAVNLSKLPFNELRDKIKDQEGYKALNRFEITKAVRQAEKKPCCCCLDDKNNPRTVKTEIKALQAKLTETEGREARREARRAIAKLKGVTRKYLG